MAIYINQESGLEKFANAALKGVQAGQQYRSNALQHQTQQNQLNEYDRTQQRRGALSRVAPGDYKGIAAAEMQFGEAGAANEALEKAKAQKTEQAYLALQAQDYDTATKLANEIHGTSYTFAGLTPDKQGLLFSAPDPKDPTRVRKVKPIPTSDFIAGLLGVKEGAKYGQAERQMQNAGRNAALLAGAARGGDKWEIAYLGDKAGKGQAMPMQIQRTSQGIFGYDDKTGKTRRLTNAEVALLRPESQAGAAPGGEAEQLFFSGLKPDPSADPSEMVAARVAGLSRARAIDASNAKIAQNRAAPAEVQAREIGQMLASVANPTPQIRQQMLQQAVASGYDRTIAASILDPRYAIPPR